MNNAKLHGCAFDGWQCFHCGEIFTTVGGAADHFGATPDSKPGCMLKVELGNERGLLMKIRELEQRLAAANGRLEEYEEKTCNCRWEGETLVRQCELHEAHVDAIHEWAERAKVAEKRLAEAESKTEREHAAVREIERLEERLTKTMEENHRLTLNIKALEVELKWKQESIDELLKA